MRKTTGKITLFNPHNRKQDSPIQITGTSVNGDFTRGNTTCGSSLAPGASCEYDVTFKPTKAGMSQGSFAISDNSATRKSSTVTLVGMVKVAPLAMKPMRLNFGKEPINSPSVPQAVTVENNNPIAVDVTVSGSGAHASDYQIANSCPASVNSGQSCSVSVTFAPTATGNRSAILAITFAGKNRNVALIGIGTAGGPTPTATMVATPTSTPAATPTATGTAAATPTDTAGATPTATATTAPTILPTGIPTVLPTGTLTPTTAPTATPTILPTGIPTILPTIGMTPTILPTVAPTVAPTATATATPTGLPSILPTGLPSTIPTALPTLLPSL